MQVLSSFLRTFSTCVNKLTIEDFVSWQILSLCLHQIFILCLHVYKQESFLIWIIFSFLFRDYMSATIKLSQNFSFCLVVYCRKSSFSGRFWVCNYLSSYSLLQNKPAIARSSYKMPCRKWECLKVKCFYALILYTLSYTQIRAFK